MIGVIRNKNKKLFDYYDYRSKKDEDGIQVWKTFSQGFSMQRGHDGFLMVDG